MITENMKLGMIAMNKLFYFAYNYPSNFIEEIWGPRQKFNLTDHLQNKFNGLYGEFGSRAVVLAFYAELDNSNRKKFLEYVMNWSGDVKLRFQEED